MSERLIDEAIRGLEKGYNAEDLDVLGKSIDILKDIKDMEGIGYTHQEDIDGTEIDDNIMLADKHFRKYCMIKKAYQKKGNNESREEMMKELEHFMTSISNIISEIRTSTDFDGERDIVKSKLREMFNYYQ